MTIEEYVVVCRWIDHPGTTEAILKNLKSFIENHLVFDKNSNNYKAIKRLLDTKLKIYNSTVNDVITSLEEDIELVKLPYSIGKVNVMHESVHVLEIDILDVPSPKEDVLTKLKLLLPIFKDYEIKFINHDKSSK